MLSNNLLFDIEIKDGSNNTLSSFQVFPDGTVSWEVTVLAWLNTKLFPFTVGVILNSNTEIETTCESIARVDVLSNQ